MATFSNMRKKNIPALLMNKDQIQALNPEIQEGQLAFDTYITNNLHQEAHRAFQDMLGKIKNKDEFKSALVGTDSYLKQLNWYASTGSMDPMAYSAFLKQVKEVHDSLQKLGILNKHQKYIESDMEKASDLYDQWYKNKSAGSTHVDVKMQPEVDDEEFQDKEQKANALPMPPVTEGVDTHLSKAYYDPRAKKWIQRKVEQINKEQEKTYEKEAEKKFKKKTETVAPSVTESFSFKDFLKESELNTLSRLEPTGDVLKNNNDSVYVNKAKPKFKKLDQKQVQADPISS